MISLDKAVYNYSYTEVLMYAMYQWFADRIELFDAADILLDLAQGL